MLLQVKSPFLILLILIFTAKLNYIISASLDSNTRQDQTFNSDDNSHQISLRTIFPTDIESGRTAIEPSRLQRPQTQEPQNERVFFRIQSFAGVYMNAFLWPIISACDQQFTNVAINVIGAISVFFITGLFSYYIGHYPSVKCQSGHFCPIVVSLEHIHLSDLLGLATTDQMIGVPFSWISAFFYFMPRNIYDALHFNTDRRIFLYLFIAQVLHCFGLFDFLVWIFKHIKSYHQ